MRKKTKDLLIKCKKEARAKSQKENQEFLDNWLSKGSLLRQLFDIEQLKSLLK